MCAVAVQQQAIQRIIQQLINSAPKLPISPTSCSAVRTVVRVSQPENGTVEPFSWFSLPNQTEGSNAHLRDGIFERPLYEIRSLLARFRVARRWTRRSTRATVLLKLCRDSELHTAPEMLPTMYRRIRRQVKGNLTKSKCILQSDHSRIQPLITLCQLNGSFTEELVEHNRQALFLSFTGTHNHSHCRLADTSLSLRFTARKLVSRSIRRTSFQTLWPRRACVDLLFDSLSRTTVVQCVDIMCVVRVVCVMATVQETSETPLSN